MLIWPWWEASEILFIIYSDDFLHFSSEQIIPFQQIHTANSEHKSTQTLIKYMLCVVLCSPTTAPKTNSSFQSPAGEKDGAEESQYTSTYIKHGRSMCVQERHRHNKEQSLFIKSYKTVWFFQKGGMLTGTVKYTLTYTLSPCEKGLGLINCTFNYSSFTSI